MYTHIQTTLRGRKRKKNPRVINLTKNNTRNYFRVQQYSARMHSSYRETSGERIVKCFREGVFASSEVDRVPLPKIQSLKGFHQLSVNQLSKVGEWT